MKLSPDQTKALEAINRWASGAGNPVFALAGYAGTGKTTIVQEWINGLDRPVICCAPTGKAAEVLRRRLNHAEVSTIHRALYKPLPPPSLAALQDLKSQLELNPENEKLKEMIAEEQYRLERRKLRFGKKEKQQQLIQEDDVVVVDEASMVTTQMRTDFIATGARILFVGDPGQLPPVHDKGFFSDYVPDAMLTEIHRQALDSPILRLSMRIRDGESIAPFQSPNCSKQPKTSLAYEQWLSYDQIITGSNQSRRRVNRFFRKTKGLEKVWPQKGEKIICLKNAEDYTFINGVQAETTDNFEFDPQMDCVLGQIIYDGNPLDTRCFYPFPFRATYDDTVKEIPWWERAAMVDTLEFDYAYAITVHKSQGSEWPRVIVADDQMMAGNKDFRRQWLYTAVTRAKEELMWLY